MSSVEDSVLDRDGLQRDLGRRVVRGAAVTLGGQWGRFLLTTGSTMVMARLLAPEAHGLVAMATAITAFAERFRDLGLSQATVQQQRITHRQVSTLFWLNTAFGVVLAACVVAAAPLVAGFFGRSELVGVMAALSTAFIFSGLTVQHQALLVRRMQFSKLAMADFSALAVSVAAALGAALAGAGYWALVVAQVAQAAARLLTVCLACRWRPGRPAHLREVRTMLAFGGNVSFTNLLNYFSRNLDNVLIGKAWGAAQLGLYAKAYSLLLLPLQQITSPLGHVALPTLSLLQQEPVRYRLYYQRAISAIAYVAMPAIMVASALSDEVIRLALGARWVGAAPIFAVLAFASVAQTVSNTNHWVYLSTGHAARMALWAVISRPLVVLSFFVGLPWGAYGVAVSYTAFQYALLIPGFAFAVKGTPLRLQDVLEAVWRPATVSALVYGLATAVRWFTAPEGSLFSVTATLACTALGFGLVLAAWPATRRDLSAIFALMRTVASKRRKSNGADPVAADVR